MEKNDPSVTEILQKLVLYSNCKTSSFCMCEFKNVLRSRSLCFPFNLPFFFYCNWSYCVSLTKMYIWRSTLESSSEECAIAFRERWNQRHSQWEEKVSFGSQSSNSAVHHPAPYFELCKSPRRRGEKYVDSCCRRSCSVSQRWKIIPRRVFWDYILVFDWRERRQDNYSSGQVSDS